MSRLKRSPARRLAGRACGLCLAAVAAAAPAASDVYTGHGMAMYGDLAYGPGFAHFDYVNPEAPKGGDVRLRGIGTFDTLNPYTLKGVAAPGLGQTYDTLTEQSLDEAFSEYGLVAETIEVPEDRSWVAFTLREQARFHDGEPVTAEDVVFSFKLLRERGHPFYRAYYGSVASVEATSERRVRFTFSEGQNRELPLIVGQMPVLPKHYWEGRDFAATTLEPPLGSGPYRIAEVEPGRSITYERVEDYWAQELPVNRGRNNFGRIRYDLYRDTTVALEAFKAGEYDFIQENVAKNWATAYQGAPFDKGLIRKEEIPHSIPTGMQAFIYNSRRPVFSDPLVREALAYAFNFEWTNENIFYGAYARTESYFSNSELASDGLPTQAELEILEPYRGEVPEPVFTQEYDPPSTAGEGGLRANLRTAFEMLQSAGYEVRNGRLVEADTGRVMSFEILLNQPTFERVVLPFRKNLERLGIEVSVRTVDTAQYQNRVDNFDFDMIVATLPQSLSPGNEQRDFWSSHAANTPGSRNLAGVSDPVIDELVELVISAPTREALINRTRALDRVLLWHHYVIPQWHTRVFRVAYWNKFDRPDETPPYGLGFDTWWVDPEGMQRVKREREKLAQ